LHSNLVSILKQALQNKRMLVQMLYYHWINLLRQ